MPDPYGIYTRCRGNRMGMRLRGARGFRPSMEKGDSMADCAAPQPRSFTAKQAAGFALAVLSVAVSFFAPGTAELTHEAITACGILLGAVFMWFCGTMPTGVVGLLGCLALFALGIRPQFSDAFSGYTSTTAWFVLAVYCMTALMQKSSLGVRLTRRFILMAGANSKRLVFAIMLATACMSSVMTDTGAVALSMSFVLPLLDLVGAKKGKSNLGKCLLLGVSLGALIGGFTTPCGHSLNVLSIGILEQTTGDTVSYLGWMIYGVPVAAMVLPLAWKALVGAFPPEPITQDKIDMLMNNQFKTGKFTSHDTKCLVLMVVLPVLWIAGNWISVFNSTSIALLGMILLFVPGMNIVSWKEFEHLASWNLFLFFGGVLSIGAAIQATGAAVFIANTFLGSGILDLPVFAALLVIAIFLYLIHTVCPISPAWCAIFLPPLLVFSQAVGLVSMAPTFLIVSLIAGSYLVPLVPSHEHDLRRRLVQLQGYGSRGLGGFNRAHKRGGGVGLSHGLRAGNHVIFRLAVAFQQTIQND